MTARTPPEPGEEELSTSHLRAAGWALLVVCFLGAGSWFAADATIAARAPGLESVVNAARSRGLAVVRERLQQPHAIPLLGSSELIYDVRYRADRFFATAPTGFTVVPLGAKAMTPLIQALTLQALGRVLGGRPIVISLSPFNPRIAERRQDWFAGNFSRLHASTAFTSSAIPASLRRETARQLAAYPFALASDPVLKLMVHVESIDSPLSVVPSALLRPIAWLDRLWLTGVDHIAGALDVVAHQAGTDSTHDIAPPVDWAALELAAREDYVRVSGSNPFGLLDSWWLEVGAPTLAQRKPVPDSLFQRRLNEWPALSELATLVHSARALGAQVLVISIPYSGVFMDAIGTSKAARTAYYDRMQAEAHRLGVTLIDNREYDLDRGLLHDPEGHLSPVGWLNFNHSMDDFVHRAAH